MSISVRVSDELYEAARIAAKTEFRSIPQQIEFWARLGRAAYDNPDLRSLRFDQLPLAGGQIKTMPLDQPMRITTLMP